jgi:pimeloyl-ACP methyl ester carboxylesterase
MTRTPNLPPALGGDRREVESFAGRLSYYRSGPVHGSVPLLLIHSINAAGSAYETLPLYNHYRRRRSVYAVDLPGFGFSERGDRQYSPRLMTDAVHVAMTEIARDHSEEPVDVIAISLGAEFLARAASENPDAFRSVGLISPSGFNRSTPDEAPVGTTRAMPWLHAILMLSGRPFFDLLTTKASIRYFLNKTWGSKQIDEGLLEYDYLTTHQPGAHQAPYAFVSGFLFSKDIQVVYRMLKLPVWMVHGVRGDFTDYSKSSRFDGRPNWSIQCFQTGALPHFEVLDQVTRSYDAFLERVSQRSARSINPDPSLTR